MKSIFKLALSLAIMAGTYHAQAMQLVNDALLAAIKSDDVEEIRTVIQDAGGLDQCINYENANAALIHYDNQDTLKPNDCGAEAFLIEALWYTENTEIIEYILEAYHPRLNFRVYKDCILILNTIPLRCARTIEIAELLLEAGANARYTGYTAWFTTLLVREPLYRTHFIQMLLKHNANFDGFRIYSFPEELHRSILAHSTMDAADLIDEISARKTNESTRIMLFGYARARGIEMSPLRVLTDDGNELHESFKMEKLAQFLTQKYKPETPFTVEDVDSFIENEAKIFRSGICKTGSLEKIAKARELGISANDPIMDLV